MTPVKQIQTHYSSKYPTTNDRILTLQMVCEAVSLTKATIYRSIAVQKFPAQVRLTPGGGRVGWREKEVHQWLRDPSAWATRKEVSA